MVILFAHLLTPAARLLGPGGAKAIIAENLLLKQQQLVVTRSRRGFVNLRLPEPHNRSAVSSLYYQAMSWAHVTSCHSQNPLVRNSR
jgi:hypothetical protein